MRGKRKILIKGAILTIFAALVATALTRHNLAAGQGKPAEAPMFKVDAAWPKPLPNHWIVGNVIGVAVDSKDHIWIVHRPKSVGKWDAGGALHAPTPDLQGKVIENDPKRPLVSVCCVPAPPVLEFDQEGNLLRHWGGPGAGYEWPTAEHGIFIDHQDNVWLGSSGAGNGPNPEGGTLDKTKMDGQVLKFTQDGKFLMQIGHYGKNRGSNDTENMGRPTNMAVDPATNELFVSDGYGNHRLVVFDATTGKYKRHWGAYGKPPNDDDPEIKGETPGNTRYDPSKPPAQTFRTPHSIALSKDGLVYLVDRPGDRIQVFKKDGTFVKEGIFFKNTMRSGSVWDADFSHDPQQKYIYAPDGENHRMYVILRETMEVVRIYGDGSRQAGGFISPHSLATDSKGNVYVGEALDGKRIQRFLYQGMAPTTIFPSQN